MSAYTETYRPIGPLADLLNRYEAPHEIQETLARRCGDIFGLASLKTVESNIQYTMRRNMGIPIWPIVEERAIKEALESRKKMRNNVPHRKF